MPKGPFVLYFNVKNVYKLLTKQTAYLSSKNSTRVSFAFLQRIIVVDALQELGIVGLEYWGTACNNEIYNSSMQASKATVCDQCNAYKIQSMVAVLLG